jgi:hypothetical protein
MKKVAIQDLKPGLVRGVEVYLPSGEGVYKETYFEWAASPLRAKFSSQEISGGILKVWHHVPVFSEMEKHADAEMFYFTIGVALMPFVDLVNGQPDMATLQIVRIQPGTQLIIAAGKAHFVPVAEGSEPVGIIVVAPKMEAPRVTLALPVKGE